MDAITDANSFDSLLASAILKKRPIDISKRQKEGNEAFG